VSRRPWALALVALVLVTLIGSCAEPALLELSLVVPEGVDPLSGADEVRVRVTRTEGQSTTTLADPQALDLSFDVEVAGEYGQVLLEAYSGGALIARGETPSFTLRPLDDAFGLLVGRAGEVSSLKTHLDAPRAAMLVAPLPSIGFLVAGGHDAAGLPSSAAEIYDHWNHTCTTLSTALPEARAEGVAVSCGSACALIALGRNRDGLASSFLSYSGAWAQIADGLDASLRRRRAAVAALEDGSYLVVGGLNSTDEPMNSMLRLRTGGGVEPGFTLLSQPMREARDEPAVASTGTAVVVVGGQAVEGLAGEVVYLASGETLALALGGQAPSVGAAAVALANGKVAIIGGRDPSGQLLADGWLVDPLTRDVTHVENALNVARAGHIAMVVNGQIVVIGGEDMSGISSSFEILSESLRSLEVKEAPGPRAQAHAVAVGAGSFLLFGGLDATGQPVSAVGLFETGQISLP